MDAREWFLHLMFLNHGWERVASSFNDFMTYASEFGSPVVSTSMTQTIQQSPFVIDGNHWVKHLLLPLWVCWQCDLGHNSFSFFIISPMCHFIAQFYVTGVLLHYLPLWQQWQWGAFERLIRKYSPIDCLELLEGCFSDHKILLPCLKMLPLSKMLFPL